MPSYPSSVETSVETSPASPRRLTRSARIRIVRWIAGLLVLFVCGDIWRHVGLTQFRGDLRQANLALFDAVNSLAKRLPAQGNRIYVITQDEGGNDLPLRKIDYCLIPQRIVMLPFHLVGRDECKPNTPVNPAGGCRYDLKADVHFTNPQRFANFCAANSVTHLLVARGDANAAATIGLPLRLDRMYLIRFDSRSRGFSEVADVAAP